MKSTVIIFRKLKDYISYPLVFISVFVVLQSLCPIIKTGDSIGILASFLFVFYICFEHTKRAYKSAICSFCALAGDIVYFSFTNMHFSLIYIILLGIISLKVIEKLNDIYSFIFLFILFVSVSVLLGEVQDYSVNVLKMFCAAVKGKGFIFGAADNFYSLFFSNRFNDFFLFKDYGGSAVKGNKVITGAVNIFKSIPGAESVYMYLTGKYFENIFLSAGIFLSLINKVNPHLKLSLSFVTAAAVLSGDARLLSLFVFFYNPLVYAGYLFVISMSYLISDLLKLGVGYIKNGSVFELLKFINSPVYFLLSGVVLLALMYFLSRMIISKYNFNDKYYPKYVQNLIKALGGEKNITAVKDGNVKVKNINSVNIILIDCDIKGNSVILNTADYKALNKYF